MYIYKIYEGVAGHLTMTTKSHKTVSVAVNSRDEARSRDLYLTTASESTLWMRGLSPLFRYSHERRQFGRWARTSTAHSQA